MNRMNPEGEHSANQLRAIANAYDTLGETYGTPMHRTTEFWARLQEQPLKDEILKARQRLGKNLGDIRLLDVGPGPHGDSRIMTGVINSAAVNEHGEIVDRSAVDDIDLSLWNVTFLEISGIALQAFKFNLVQDFLMAGGVPSHAKELGDYIVGDAQAITDYLPDGSQDIVIAALCDHIPDQTAFFDQALAVLGPGGTLITTFPAEELNGAIRQQLYGIQVDTTRFIVDGETHYVPSRLVTPDSLSTMYQQAGFSQMETANILFDPTLELPLPPIPSPTMIRGAKLLGKQITDIPILVIGSGVKPVAAHLQSLRA